MTIEDIDKELFFHPFTHLREHERNGPLTIVEGHGSTLTDTRGRAYLDAMAGLWCVNIGYGNTEMAETLREQTERLAYYHTFASMGNEPVARLAQRLISMAPGEMSKVFFGNSGSDANDTHGARARRAVRGQDALRGVRDRTGGGRETESGSPDDVSVRFSPRRSQRRGDRAG